MEKPYIFWSTGRGCLMGLVVLLLAAGVITVGILLRIDRLALLAAALAVVGPVAFLTFRVDRRARAVSRGRRR